MGTLIKLADLKLPKVVRSILESEQITFSMLNLTRSMAGLF